MSSQSVLKLLTLFCWWSVKLCDWVKQFLTCSRLRKKKQEEEHVALMSPPVSGGPGAVVAAQCCTCVSSYSSTRTPQWICEGEYCMDFLMWVDRWVEFYFAVFFLGVNTTSAAMDEQDTFPVDVNTLPLPPEVTPKPSPEVSAAQKRNAFHRCRKKSTPEEAGHQPAHVDAQEKPAASPKHDVKPTKRSKLDEAWEWIFEGVGNYKHRSFHCMDARIKNLILSFCPMWCIDVCWLGNVIRALRHTRWPIRYETRET